MTGGPDVKLLVTESPGVSSVDVWWSRVCMGLGLSSSGSPFRPAVRWVSVGDQSPPWLLRSLGLCVVVSTPSVPGVISGSLLCGFPVSLTVEGPGSGVESLTGALCLTIRLGCCLSV